MKNKICRFVLAALLSLCAALLATNTWAEDSKTGAEDAKPAPEQTVKEQFEDVWTRDKLTGDWGGWRTDVLDHGIDIDLRLSQYYQGVTSGGVDTNSEYGGTMDYRVHIDTSKPLGTWVGLTVDICPSYTSPSPPA